MAVVLVLVLVLVLVHVMQSGPFPYFFLLWLILKQRP
jgi:hypothetical protein